MTIDISDSENVHTSQRQHGQAHPRVQIQKEPDIFVQLDVFLTARFRLYSTPLSYKCAYRLTGKNRRESKPQADQRTGARQVHA
jgi:hypothetical protein